MSNRKRFLKLLDRLIEENKPDREGSDKFYEKYVELHGTESERLFLKRKNDGVTMNENDVKQLVRDEIKKFLYSWNFVVIILCVIIISVAISLALVWI